MKRHAALVPLSHDHHHALVQARRLVRAAGAPDAARVAAAFTRFFHDEIVKHFREEEELLFPLVADADEARPLLVQALLEHQRLRALVAELEGTADVGMVARELGRLLEAHVRLEERELFPLIEHLVADDLERRAERGAEAAGPRRAGPVWGAASEDLNATVLVWEARGGTPEHVNDERDVLVAVLDGSATLRIDDDEREFGPGDVVIIDKGRKRMITAGDRGVRYLSVHLRRPPLQVRPLRQSDRDEVSELRR